MESPFELPEITEFSDQGYAILGKALAYATSYETNCKALASLIDIKGNSGILDSEDNLNEFLDSIQKRNLNNSIQNIKKSIFPSNSITEILRKGREARNFIAHESAIGVFRLFDNDERKKLIREIKEKIIEIAEANIIIIILGFNITNEPVPTLSFLSSYPENVAKWVCNGHGDLTH